MVTTQLCVTLDLNQLEFIKKNSLSPTRLLRSKIDEMMENGTLDANASKVRLKNWMATAYKMRDFIENQGLLDDYMKIK